MCVPHTSSFTCHRSLEAALPRYTIIITIMAFRYYCLAVSLAAMVSVTSTASTSTVYGRRKHHQTVGSTIHFGQNVGQGENGNTDYSALDDSPSFSQPADEATVTTSEESNASPSYQRYQRNLDRFLMPSPSSSSSSFSGNAYQHHSSVSPVVSSTVYGHRDPAMMDEPSLADDDESMQWAPSNVGQVATYARGSNEEDSFTVQSGKNSR